MGVCGEMGMMGSGDSDGGGHGGRNLLQSLKVRYLSILAQRNPMDLC